MLLYANCHTAQSHRQSIEVNNPALTSQTAEAKNAGTVRRRARHRVEHNIRFTTERPNGNRTDELNLMSVSTTIADNVGLAADARMWTPLPKCECRLDVHDVYLAARIDV